MSKGKLNYYDFMTMPEKIFFQIGKRLKELRKKYGFTQARLAEQAGIETSFIAHIEVGRKGVSIPTLMKIADVLDMPVEVFLRPEGETKGRYDFKDKKLFSLIKDSTPRERKIIYKVARYVLKE